MVTDNDRHDPSADRPRSTGVVDSDRAQLILIGAIALAVVIVGLAIVSNSLVVTQTSDAADVTIQSDDATEFDFESRSGVRSLLVRLNHRHRNLTATELGDDATDNVSTYTRLLSESYVSSGGQSVTLSYHNDSSAFGDRIVQLTDNNVTEDDTPPDSTWDLVSEGRSRQLGWFTMNLDLEGTSETPARLKVGNQTGHWVNYSINRTEGADSVGLAISSNVSHAGNASTVCQPSRDRVLLDLVAGRALSSECTFNGTDAVTGRVHVIVESGQNLYGQYELVVNETRSGSPYYDRCLDGGPTVDADQPCASPAIWTANVSAQFTGSQVSYANRFNVSVYGGTR